MRKPFLLAAGLLVSAISAAHAVDLKDCSKGTTTQRLACLQANIVLLNSSYQKVAAELRQDVVDLTKTVNDLTSQMGNLTGQVKDLTDKVNHIPPPPDLANVVRRNQPIKLGFSDAQCLTFPTGIGGDLVGPTGGQVHAQILTLLQECNSSPSMSFK